MAYISDYAVTIDTAGTASLVCEMPAHAAGDLLVAFGTKDAAAAFTTFSAGWNAVQTVVSAGAGGGVYVNRAATAAETLTFTLTTDQCNVVVLCIKDVETVVDSGAGALTINVVASGLTFTRTTGSFTTDGFSAGQTVIMSGFTNAGNNGAKQIVSITGSGTILTVLSLATLVDESGNNNERVISTGLDVSARSTSDDTSLPLTGIGLTTIANNCLILHGLHADIGAGISARSPWVNVSPQDDAASSTSVSYSFKTTAGAVTAPEHWSTIITGVDERSTVIAVRGSGADLRPPYIPLSTTPSTLVMPMCGLATCDPGAWIAAASIAITSVAGKTVTGILVANTLDSGYNPFRASATNAGASSATNLNHMEYNSTATFNLTTLKGLLFGTWQCTIPRDYLDLGKPTQGGVYVLAGSTTTAWKAWVVGGQFDKETTPDRQNYLIQVENSDTIYGSAGAADYTVTDYLAFGSAGYYGAPSIRWSELHSVGEVVLAGGATSLPITFQQVVDTINRGAGNIPLLQQAGALATVWCPIRFGGTEAIVVGLNLNTFQFPRRADEVDYTHFHCAPDKIGIEFYGTGSGDSLSFTNCLFTSPSSYYWRFNSSHSASTVMDFSGSSVVNANVTLRSTSDLDNVTFIDCATFTQNSATLTNCSFDNTKVTSAAPADAALISNSSFVSGGTGHAIEIGGTVADIELTGITFSGYSGTSTNAPIYVNIASGAMTITITDGTTPTIRTAGATVTVVAGAVNASVHVTTTGGTAIQNARVLVVAAAGGPFPFDATVTISRSGATATVVHTAHVMETNDKVQIKGANQLDYNGVFTITKIDANSYSYTVANTPATPATGTIKATFAVLSGLTDASGDITMSRVFSSAQPISGRSRKSSAAPYYKSSGISGSVSSTLGFSAAVQMILDE